jgi:DNA adenine methylase
LLIEPFAGGGIVSLTAAFENLVDHVVMVELDADVAAVWQTILGGQGNWLADRILSFNLTVENVRECLSNTAGGTRELAFRTILKNRTFHGGILAPGATFVRHGENGKGISSRWYPKTLSNRILNIHRIRDRFTFHCADGIEVMVKHANDPSVSFFIDPPYTAGRGSGKRAGTRLYRHHQLDHERLFEVASRVAGDVILTYDNAEDVRALASSHSFSFAPIAMKNTHHAKMTELVIGRDLRWLT